MDGLAYLAERHLLTSIVFLPLAGALALLLLEVSLTALSSSIQRFSALTWRVFGLVFALLGLALAAELWLLFDPAAGGLQLVEHAAWLGDWGVSYYVGVDGISLLLVMLAAFLYPLALLASWGEPSERARHLVVLLSALQTGLLGALLSLNLLTFFVFVEASAVPVYFLVGLWSRRGSGAATRYMRLSALGSALLLLGILLLGSLHAQQFGATNFDLFGFGGAPGLIETELDGAGPWWTAQGFLFAAFAIALFIKAGLFPLHFWTPDATVESPPSASVLLAAVGLKLGAYGLVRFALPLFPLAAAAWAPWMCALGGLGALYAALLAVVQTDLERLVAYWSLSIMGLVCLGIFGLNPIALEGALLQMVHHGLVIGGLLLLSGMLAQRRAISRLGELSGLAGSMPVFAAIFTLLLLSAAGTPLLGGFSAAWLIFLGAYPSAPWLAAAAILTLGLLAVFAFWLLGRALFGALPGGGGRQLAELDLREKLVACSVALPVLWMGLSPMTFLGPVERSVGELLESMQRRGAAGMESGPEAAAQPRPGRGAGN
ncbi:MAG: NADH-quinone oxidoreductase subunit M [Proteobacteria bacterium]|nr:NADH-quinone oxidoreductase subunit M [Pseudomonadota bacterium]